MTQSGQHDHSPKNLVQVRIKELAEGLMSQQGGRKAFLDWTVLDYADTLNG